MGKVLEFKPSGKETAVNKQAAEVIDIKTLRKMFTDADIEQIERELEQEAEQEHDV